MGVFLLYCHLSPASCRHEKKPRVTRQSLSLTHSLSVTHGQVKRHRNKMNKVNDRGGSSPCRKSRRVGTSCRTVDAVEEVRHHHSAGSCDGGAVVQEVRRREVRGDVAFAVVSVQNVGDFFFACRVYMITGFFDTMLFLTAYITVVPETVTSLKRWFWKKMFILVLKKGSLTSSRAK